jgi:hypothetical protein
MRLFDDRGGFDLDQEVRFPQRRHAQQGDRLDRIDAELRCRPAHALAQQRHLLRTPVDDVDRELRDVSEGAADPGQGGGDVEIALLDLGGEVPVAHGPAVGVAGDLPRQEASFDPVATDSCR